MNHYFEKNPDPSAPVLEARGLTKKFGNFIAVDGISFKVFRGECFGILGPNGAGKTSTIRMIYGFSPLSGGEMKVFGLDIKRHWRKIRSHIGVCQQENSLDQELSVLKNLEVFARFFNLDRAIGHQRALKLLEFFALEQRRESPVVELSGGMMRRLVLARSLINEPDILILDEPTTGLDPQSRHQIWERLDNLRREGISILLTTHYMDEAERLCDRLIIMDNGRILVEGRPADLIREYAGKHVLEVTAGDTDSKGGLKEFLRENRVTHDDLGNRTIIYFDERNNLYRQVRDEFCAEGCLIRMAGLEDVFLKLTGRGLRD